jgi:hypothetical protein
MARCVNGHDNRDGIRFCTTCGAAVETDELPQREPPTPPAPPEPTPPPRPEPVPGGDVPSRVSALRRPAVVAALTLIVVIALAGAGVGVFALTRGGGKTSDQSIADAGLVTARDLGSGWKASSSANATTASGGCFPPRSPRAHAKSPRFAGPAASIRSGTEVYESSGAALRTLKTIENSDVTSCEERATARPLESRGYTDVSVFFTQTDTPPHGPDSVGYDYDVFLTSPDGASHELVARDDVVRVGRAIVILTSAGDADQSGLPANRAAVVEAIVRRVAAAQG